MAPFIISIIGTLFNVLDCDVLVNEFDLQSCYYVHFRTNTFGISINPLIHGLMSRVLAIGPGDPSSIPGPVISKTQKMEHDAALLNTQPYKVRIKGKVEQCKE